MTNNRRCSYLICVVIFVCLFAFGNELIISKPSQPAKSLSVAAASDLRFAFTEVAQNFEKRTGQKVTISFGSSGNLARQIENGAPFDLFASANTSFIDRLERKGFLAENTRQVYAVGHIVLASSKHNGNAVTKLEDALSPGIKKFVIANPEHAPYGLAAKEALIKAGVWDKIQNKLVMGENVFQALQFIRTGNAEAGIVAQSVANVPEIAYESIDSRSYSPLKQSMAIMKASHNKEAARAFIDYLNSNEGRSIMKNYGFSLPKGQSQAGEK